VSLRSGSDAAGMGARLSLRYRLARPGGDADGDFGMSDGTPSQTVGPFFHFGLCFDAGPIMVDPSSPLAITIEGRVIDGAGAVVPDALLEVWQADERGRYRCAADPRSLGIEDGFDGFARVPTDAEGRFRLTTLKPGKVGGPGGSWQAPHLLINVFARGLL